MAKKEKTTTDYLEEAGLNSVYRNFIKKIDKGLLGGNKPGDILAREKFSEAEKAFLDPQVSTCFLLLVFSLMKKKVIWEPIVEGKRAEIKKSKEIADYLNFSLKKLKDGGVRQLQFDLMTAKFFGFSLVEKVYDILLPEQSSKYKDYYYYKNCKAKRPGLWDFVYDEFENVIGYRSLMNISKTWSISKFLRMSYLPTFNNPNGNGDFDRVWRFWDAKREFIIFLLTLGARLAKGRQTILKGKSNGQYNEEEINQLLDDLANNLAVYIPEGYEVDFTNFDVGALQHFLSVLRWLDSQIAIAMIGSSLSVNESQGAGTNAQSTVHNENKFTFEDYSEGIMCDALDEDYARDLITLNFDTSKYPEEIWPSCKLVQDKNHTDMDKVTLFEKLKSMGVIDTDTEIDLNYLREEFNLPENDELFAKLEDLVNQVNNEDDDQDLAETGEQNLKPEKPGKVKEKDVSNLGSLYI